MLGKEVRTEAINHILPYWMRLQDVKNGSYFGYVGQDLVVNESYQKGGIATARILWSFSAAYNLFGDKMYLEHARHAYHFLCEHIMDTENRGMNWMVNYDGTVVDGRKHVYAQAFGIYGLTEYYRATGDEKVFNQAMELFELIETKGFDTVLNCYGEEYDVGWRKKENEMLSENGVQASITTNTLLHILEAYTQLAEVALPFGIEVVKERLQFVVDIFVDRIWNKKIDHMRVFFDQGWNELLDLRSYGHDIEASWLFDRALSVLGKSSDKNYVDFVERIASQILAVAVDGDGSLLYEMEKGKVNTDRIWWCQAEALVGFCNMYVRTQDSVWLNATKRIWEYIKLNFIDQRDGGEWFYSLDSKGNLLGSPITEPWKTPYHNLRCCIEVYKLLQNEKE